jgi:hypothetical protein
MSPPPANSMTWSSRKRSGRLRPSSPKGLPGAVPDQTDSSDGELIIYAPHITEVCVSHGKTILDVGYHCRDYFLKQWDRFKDYPWGVLAHSTHVRGIGTFENGVERCRAKVTLATGIPESVCQQLNLGYRDPLTIRPGDFANREDEGVLLVPKAGEMLFHLTHPPKWAGGQ